MKLIPHQHCRGVRAEDILKRQQLLGNQTRLVSICIRYSASAMDYMVKCVMRVPSFLWRSRENDIGELRSYPSWKLSLAPVQLVYVCFIQTFLSRACMLAQDLQQHFEREVGSYSTSTSHGYFQKATYETRK